MPPSMMEQADDRLPASDHDLLIRIHERSTEHSSRLSKIEESQGELKQSIGGRFEKIEIRLRALEDWKNNLQGRLGVVVAIASIVGGLVAQYLFSLMTHL